LSRETKMAYLLERFFEPRDINGESLPS
jgi:hypothetical protein